MILPPEQWGVRCISIGYFVPENEAVIWRGPMLHKALEQFLTDVYWDEPDFLLIDMPPGTGDIALSLSQYLPRGRGVRGHHAATGGPEGRPPVGGDGRQGQPAGQGRDREHVVVHRRRRQALRAVRLGRRAGARRRDRRARCSASCRCCTALREGGDDGQPITAVDPDSEAAKPFRAIAEQIAVDLKPRKIFSSQLKVI